MNIAGGLLEREVVTASAAELIDRVAAGGTGALFVVGEAGLGKTSLVDQARRRAVATDLMVGLGRGHSMETRLPFGVLAQALDGVGGRGLLTEDEPGSAPAADWAARYYRVLRWLQGRSGGSLFLGIDDLHWADADSIGLMSFLCRRMDSAPFGLIASLRPWPAGAREAVTGLVHEGRGTVLRLVPLSQQAAGSLLQARLGRHVSAADRQRAFELSAGNPLLLEQLAVAMGKGMGVPEAAEVGMAAFGQGVLLSRFAGLSPGVMRCAQAASVLGSGFLPEIAAQMAGLNEDEVDAAIEALSQTGLIKQRPGSAADFVHPLFRQALYDDLAGPVRARWHARAFTLLHARGLDAQAAEQAIQTDLAGDVEAVAVLEKAGRAARQAGALATAVSWLDTAVTMAGERVSVPLLMAQAEAQLASGRAGPAIAAYQLLLTRPDLESPARVETLWMLGRAFAAAGRHDRAATAFDEAASLARGDDPATAVEVLLDAAFCAELSAGPASALVVASRARDLASSVGLTLRTRVEADWALLALLCGDPAGAAAAETAASWHGDRFSGLGAEKSTWGGRWGPANSIGYCACFMERLAEAERVFALARAAAEGAGVPDAIAGLAAGHSYALFRMGRLEESLAAIKVAVSLMELVPMMDAFASVGIASLCLYMGKLDESSQWCQRVEATATAREQLTARLFLYDVLGHRHLREGAIADACELYTQLETAVHRMGIGEPCAVPWPRHAMNAYLAAGRVDEAERVLAWLDQAAARLPCRFPRIAAATGHAQLAELRGDDVCAEGHYRAALALHGEIDLPVEHCETLLAYGGFLRRAGRPAPARPMLAQAAEIAQRTGALWLADLAHQELKVAGGRLRHRADPGVLSAQEERVAVLVATGATNADIARQLYLSVSTVETHLERIYSKLGIHTRYQLIAMAAKRQPEP